MGWLTLITVVASGPGATAGRVAFGIGLAGLGVLLVRATRLGLVANPGGAEYRGMFRTRQLDREAVDWIGFPKTVRRTLVRGQHPQPLRIGLHDGRVIAAWAIVDLPPATAVFMAVPSDAISKAGQDVQAFLVATSLPWRYVAPPPPLGSSWTAR